VKWNPNQFSININCEERRYNALFEIRCAALCKAVDVNVVALPGLIVSYAGQRSISMCGIITALVLFAHTAAGQSVEELRDLPIEDLANIEISSVSKSAEKLSEAPAAVYVINHDDIIRSGATTIPEMLRLAPNLEVAELTPTSYAITARGFNVGDNASLSNKLLVLIDGRSVYTPMFGGVYWDMQAVLPEDIERIEVISGPGATLWGANAVNGVVNIITRKSSDTQGGLLDVGAGSIQRGGSLQYGGQLGQDLTYRVHAEGFDFSQFKSYYGEDVKDGYSRTQGGFRTDWTPPGEAVSVQGDIYAEPNPNGFVSGRDLVASWQHQLDGGSSLQLQAYYDNAARSADNGGSRFVVDTYDIELQHNFTVADWNSVVWGAGDRVFSYVFRNTALELVPASQTLNLANIFAQDTISLTDEVKLTLGIKLENEPYVGLEPMPSVRASWKAADGVLLWGAISRALRSPTPVDEDLREYAGSLDVLNGSSNFKPEVLTAYELGTRVQASPRVSFSMSTFYDDYNDIRTIGLAPPGGSSVFSFGNGMDAIIYGVEVWGNYRVTDWWRLSAGFNIQHESLRFARQPWHRRPCLRGRRSQPPGVIALLCRSRPWNLLGRGFALCRKAAASHRA
jgi:iron complex outermembrane receptor protein